MSWRASMMANSSRDPYWQAAVRRETIDHPSAAARNRGRMLDLPHADVRDPKRGRRRSRAGSSRTCRSARARSEDDRLAADGVSCTVCHQIGPERLGTRESFTGGFVITPPTSAGERRMFGPFAVDAGRTGLMRSATGMTPTEATHIRDSELCATCHTLITQALGPQGQVVGELPEQVPYLEWRHSAFVAEKRSCQSCHMPTVAAPTRIASVLGEEREGLGAAHVPRRQLLHAPHAEPLSRRAGGRGAAAGARRRGPRHDRAAPAGHGIGLRRQAPLARAAGSRWTSASET